MEAERLRLDEPMISVSEIDHSPLDRPEVLTRLFHPRSEYREREKLENAIDPLIPVEGNLVVGGRFHLTSKSAPNMTFLRIPGANHNDIFAVGLTEYMREVKVLTEKASQHRL